MRSLAASIACAAALVAAGAASGAAPASEAMPHYDHIWVIIEENHTTDEIVGNPGAPTFTRLAKAFGFASNYYALRHPSEPNYVALVGGDTFGIQDDDAFFCKPGLKRWECKKSDTAGYVGHSVQGRSLADQLTEKGLTWKGYFEDIPEPGSLAYHWPPEKATIAGKPDALYAVKHNGFMTFKNVQDAPDRAERIVGFDVLERDIAAGTLPNFAHIVPNQCNDMHGLKGHDVPASCTSKNPALIPRADVELARLTTAIMGSSQWQSAENDAIVVTFDENDSKKASSHPNGCCGFNPKSSFNPGGGWIPTIVITNHGPRGLSDPTPYNHYALLRTIEDAFGLDHLRHAGDDRQGVVSMTPLFAVAGKSAGNPP